MNPELHVGDGGLIVGFEVDATLADRLPTHLYHYTTIEALAHILDGQSLKFNRLDQCNDPLEAASVDIAEANTCVFVSCWTAEHEESIPLWGLYTHNLAGVRLKMPTNMFPGRAKPGAYKGGDTAVVLSTEFVEISRASGSPGRTRMIHGPNKVTYTDDAAMRAVQCIHRNGDFMRVALHELGTTKTLPWSYESEWRYRIYAIPDEGHYEPGIDFESVIDFRKHPVDQTSLLVPLAAEALSELVVTLGPKTTRAEEIIVRSLLDRYAPSATTEKSKLLMR